MNDLQPVPAAARPTRRTVLGFAALATTAAFGVTSQQAAQAAENRTVIECLADLDAF
ncbi:hypothetical protein [Kribbella italica]|uniref:Uncharacterized protein n=1 Tax=Kribbella italica TaxID=1540520 RepID=A0A7W9MUJ0_9ACTN|nr:hypothetical protein [Kribbella italica]MBB5836235.1 hypothetical protein [Kribbella italica]